MTTRTRLSIGAATIVAAVLLAFLFAKLTSTGKPAALDQTTATPTSAATSDSTSDSPTPDPTTTTDTASPTPTTTSASPTASATATTVTPSTSASATTPPVPPAPLTIGQLVQQMPGCLAGTCKVATHFASTQTGTPLQFAVVALPAKKGDFEKPYRMALFDNKTQTLAWLSPIVTGLIPEHPEDLAKQDSLGHIFVVFFMGAHASELFVLDPANGPKATLIGPDQGGGVRAWASDTGGAHGEDTDGDGTLEVILPINDYSPNFATGNTTVYRYAWNGTAYADNGCAFYAHGSATGTEYPPGDPKCAAN